MAYVMPWPRQLSKHPLFAPNASLSSLEGDDKEPSCAGEAILALKSSQSHPLFMCKHASWQAMKDNAIPATKTQDATIIYQNEFIPVQVP